MKYILSLWAVFLCLVSFCHSMDRHRNKVCYEAMTCIHTGREKCGSDSKGNRRRFYDSCDLLEYNCLKGTNYVKSSQEKCKNLPPIDDGHSEKDTNKNEVYDDNKSKYEGNVDNKINMDDGEKGIQGTINIDDEGNVEGEIEIDDEALEDVASYEYDGENNGAGGTDGEDGVDGEINVDDDGSIEGTMNVEDEPDQGNGDDYIEGEIIADDNDGDAIIGPGNHKAVEGEIVIDDEGNVQGSIQLITAEEDEDPVESAGGQEEDGPNHGENIVGEIETKDTYADVDQAVQDIEDQFHGVEGNIESADVQYE